MAFRETDESIERVDRRTVGLAKGQGVRWISGGSMWEGRVVLVFGGALFRHSDIRTLVRVAVERVDGRIVTSASREVTVEPERLEVLRGIA